MNLPRWLRLSLILPLLGLNLFVLRCCCAGSVPSSVHQRGADCLAGRPLVAAPGSARPLTMVLVLGLTVGVVVLSGLWLVPWLIEQLGEPTPPCRAGAGPKPAQSLARESLGGIPTDLSPSPTICRCSTRWLAA